MSQSTGTVSSSESALALELIESDRRYFEAAARIDSIVGASIARVPGFTHVPAGCVVQRVDPAMLPRDSAHWLALLEGHLAELGCRWSRLYLVGRHPGLEAEMLARGYRPQEEVGYVLPVHAAPDYHDARPLPPTVLRPITSDDDWAAKVALQRVCGAAPDGYEYDAEEWVGLERIRAAAGFMRPFFLVSRGAICGTLALAGGDRLLRIQNLLVHPSWRGMGVARAALRRAAGFAWREGWSAIGGFAVVGDPCEQLYQATGFEAAARQTEWLRPLGFRIEVGTETVE